MSASVTVKTTGPVLEGKLGPVLEACMPQIVDRVGNEVLQQVQSNLNASIKHPTPII